MNQIFTEKELLSLSRSTYLLVYRPINLDAPNWERSLVIAMIQEDAFGDKELVTQNILFPAESDFHPMAVAYGPELYYGCDIPILGCERALEELGLDQENSKNITWVLTEDEVLNHVLMETI